MKKLFLIIGVLIFIVVAYFITVGITKRIVEEKTEGLTQEEIGRLTPKGDNKSHDRGRLSKF